MPIVKNQKENVMEYSWYLYIKGIGMNLLDSTWTGFQLVVDTMSSSKDAYAQLRTYTPTLAKDSQYQHYLADLN